jgi:hypothetical protein
MKGKAVFVFLTLLFPGSLAAQEGEREPPGMEGMMARCRAAMDLIGQAQKALEEGKGQDPAAQKAAQEEVQSRLAQVRDHLAACMQMMGRMRQMDMMGAGGMGMMRGQGGAGGMAGMGGMGMGGMCTCPPGMMHGPGRWVGIIAGVLLAASLISVLIALTVFLIRRSRPGPARGA